LIFKLAALNFGTQGFFFQIKGVVACVNIQLALARFNRTVDNPVKKPPIV